jgi:hypothetical protein
MSFAPKEQNEENKEQINPTTLNTNLNKEKEKEKEKENKQIIEGN